MEEVTSGTVKVSLVYGSVPTVDESLDLCDLVTQVKRKCPLGKGPLSFKLEENIPDYVPSVSSNLLIVKSYEKLNFKYMYLCRVTTAAKLLFLIRMARNWHV